MPEPFKNLLSKSVISGMGDHLAKAWPAFDRSGFVKMAAKNLDTLELKQRSTQITETLGVFLPDDYERAVAIMLASLAPEQGEGAGIADWAVMPMADYVGLNGIGHFDLSMTLFKEMTKRSSSEFGIRYFLSEEPERTLSVLQTWTQDPNHHVRRLVSEGTRPRLPWGMRLQKFVEDPAPVLSLLQVLKDDKEEYVRRSVANNLNDIAKDHADVVAKIAGRWMKGASKDRKRLVRHACRTLIKQGHKGTLKALGYDDPALEVEKLHILTPKVQFGDALTFEFALTSTSKKSQPLIIDYAIHHRKANGSTSAKVFKWKNVTLEPLATLAAKKNHPIKKISTRVYYPGQHRVEILVNGVSCGGEEFELVM